jgi:hypothetical protein
MRDEVPQPYRTTGNNNGFVYLNVYVFREMARRHKFLHCMVGVGAALNYLKYHH